VLLDHRTCPVGMVTNMLQFFAQESCGWCTPCREGLQWMAALLEDIEYGRGQPGDIEVLAEGNWFMQSDKCFCDLAPGAMQPLESALRLFADDFARHIDEGGCHYRRHDSDAPAQEGTTW
jgi:NADH-quinone oxidoreductase subunit F